MQHIAFFIPNLSYGGAEKVVVNLVKEMSSQGIELELIVTNSEGASQKHYLNQIPKEVKIINLGTSRILNTILPLANYIKKQKPTAIISHLSHVNVAAILAQKISHSETQLILVEHNTFSAHKSRGFTSKLVKYLMKLLYPQAKFIVSVSEAVRKDLEIYLDLESQKIKTIYNPVVSNELFIKAGASLNHPWFQSNWPPVFLAVGRLVELKDFSTLIKALALLRKHNSARLVILGEGHLRVKLENLAKDLGISEDVSLEGFVENPYAYMSRATALVLSSRSEGLPTVLIEAMACGCPIISTDCLSGPKEILDAGRYGALVPVGDEKLMSKAMLKILEEPPTNKEILIQRAINIASSQKATTKYLELLEYK